MNKYTTLFTLVIVFVLSSCKETRTNGCLTSGNSYGGHVGEFHVDDHVAVYIPNIFTPNGDAINDQFKIFVTALDSTVITNYLFEIYYNQTLYFTTSNTLDTWDGYYNEQLQEGEFHFEATITTENSQVFYYDDFCCIPNPSDLWNCEFALFPDQIDPQYGFVWATAEPDYNCD